MNKERKQAVRGAAPQEQRALVNVLIGIEEQLEHIATLLESPAAVPGEHVAYYEAVGTPDPAHPGWNLYAPGVLVRGIGSYPDRYFKAVQDYAGFFHPGRYVGLVDPPAEASLFDQDAEVVQTWAEPDWHPDGGAGA